MKKILETPRLVLREFEWSDAIHLFELNADPEVVQYTGDPPFESIAEAKTFLQNYTAYKETGYGRWAVIRSTDQVFLGWCGLKLHPEYVDLGYRFFKKEWGKGYASEAAKACIKYGFEVLGLETIVGRVLPENTASVRVLEKMGMHYWKSDTCKGLDNASYYRISIRK